jgi:hypothetical protein
MKIKIVLTLVLTTIVMTGVFAIQHIYGGSDKKTDCHISAGPCMRVISEENIRVMFAVEPTPVKAMKDLLFVINLEGKSSPVTGAKVTIDLTMPGMFMGVNRPVLIHKGEGRYEGRGVLPQCPEGGKVWKAEVGIEIKGRRASVSYVFEVE